MRKPRTLAQRRWDRIKASVRRLTVATEPEHLGVLTVEDLGADLSGIERGDW